MYSRYELHKFCDVDYFGLLFNSARKKTKPVLISVSGEINECIIIPYLDSHTSDVIKAYPLVIVRDVRDLLLIIPEHPTVVKQRVLTDL